MRILIAISHPSHANFFKVAARILKKEGHDIFITTLRRGKLVQIVEKEYSGFEIYTAGIHKGNRFSIIFSVNILRFLKLFKYSFVNKIDFGLSVGSFTLGAALKLLFTPNVQFDDDPERKMNILLEKLTSSRIYFPKVIEPKGKIRNFNGLKEWSHLSPKYFKPDENSLKEFGLKVKEYILIRDISTGSLNYMGQDPEIILRMAEKIPGNFKVVLSLEDKNNFKKYPENWIILNEPVFDFYSLLYYSKIVISTGDSMARESAMLGVPGIYCGFRDMKANDILINEGLVIHSKPENIIENVNRILNGEFNTSEQEKIRGDLLNKWDDVTDLITEIIKEFDTKK